MKYKQTDIDINLEEPEIGKVVSVTCFGENYWKTITYNGNKSNIDKWTKYTPLYSQEQQDIYNKKALFFLDTWIKLNIKWLIDKKEVDFVKPQKNYDEHEFLYCCEFDKIKDKLDYLGFEIEHVAFCGDLFFKFTDKIDVI